MDPQIQKNPSGSQALIKKIIPQLLISLSLFSFLLSYSSLYNSFSSSSSSSLLQRSSPKFHHYLSGNSFHLLSKNSIFLICNGLLVFLSKTSGFIQPPSAHDLSDVLHVTNIADTLHRSVIDVAGDGGEKRAEQVSISIADSDQGETVAPDHDSEDSEKCEDRPDSGSCWLFDDEDDEEQLYLHQDEHGDGEGEAETKEEMSTEELNQKFEDFIRKMREEIIVDEARH